MNGLNLDASTRWHALIRDAQYQQVTRPRAPEDLATRSTAESAKQNWRRVTQVARRAGDDDDSEASEDVGVENREGISSQERQEQRKQLVEARERRKKTSKMMDLSYFLEMVDQKHRHGSNLRKYHAHWTKQSTNQSFFYWLDQGKGKDLNLRECSRERLDRMQVRYLSREERLHYLVKVDAQGLLIWVKNGEPVWTKDELFKDSMAGIVPTSDLTPAYIYNGPPETWSSDESSTSEPEEDVHSTRPDEGEQYINGELHQARGPAKMKHVSAAVIFNHMMSSSLKKGHKWIFVADTSFNLYIGYKQAGAFQHSSFLHGSRILAAGQIKVKRGSLRRLSPSSGHYRPPAKNFRAFVKDLEDAGVDMSRVSISQSYAVLIGLEAYTKTRRKLKAAESGISHQRDKVFNPDKVREEEEAHIDTSQSAKREKEFLQQQRAAQQGAKEHAKAENGALARIYRLIKRTRKKDDPDGGSEMRQVAGSGPEKGVPPPKGKLLRP